MPLFLNIIISGELKTTIESLTDENTRSKEKFENIKEVENRLLSENVSLVWRNRKLNRDFSIKTISLSEQTQENKVLQNNILQKTENINSKEKIAGIFLKIWRFLCI